MSTKRMRPSGSWEYTIRRKGVLPKPLSLTFDSEEEGDSYVRRLEQMLDAGILSVQPNATIVMGGGILTCTGFPYMLWNGAAPDGSTGHPTFRWNVIAWHWYETSADITAAYDGTGTPYNVLANLNQYGTPIIMTEIGFNAGSDTPAEEAAYVTSALETYLGYRFTYNVQAVFWHEHYDVPESDGLYGLIDDDGETEKPAYFSYGLTQMANPV